MESNENLKILNAFQKRVKTMPKSSFWYLIRELELLARLQYELNTEALEDLVKKSLIFFLNNFLKTFLRLSKT